MKKLLHIIATPRDTESRTLQVSKTFLNTVKNKYPDLHIDTLNVFEEELPELTFKRVQGKYVLLGGKDLTGELKTAWNVIVACINRFLAADTYLVSAPMWNFSIPYKLKQYIDVIVQPKYLFRYTDKGVEGLAKNKKMIIISSSGGDYSTEDTKAFDFQGNYLKAIFGFVGINDIEFIRAQPMVAMGPEVEKDKIEAAKKKAGQAALEF